MWSIYIWIEEFLQIILKDYFVKKKNINFVKIASSFQLLISSLLISFTFLPGFFVYIMSQMMSFESILPMMPRYSIVLEVDWQGKILESWHTNRTDFSRFSEAKIIVSINLNSNQYCLVKCICRLNHFNRNQSTYCKFLWSWQSFAVWFW